MTLQLKFNQKKPKPVTVTATVSINSHEGEEEKTVNQVQQILTRATAAEIDTLAKLFANDSKRNMAMGYAKKFF